MRLSDVNQGEEFSPLNHKPKEPINLVLIDIAVKVDVPVDEMFVSSKELFRSCRQPLHSTKAHNTREKSYIDLYALIKENQPQCPTYTGTMYECETVTLTIPVVNTSL